MQYQVSIQQVPQQTVLSMRSRTTVAELPQVVGRSFARVFGATRALHATPVGAPFVIYHAFDSALVDAEVCVPVDRTDEPTAPIRARALPAARVARILHVGPYTEIAAAYRALNAWIAADACQPAGAFRERYLDGPDDGPPEAYRTEVEVPIQAALEPASSW